MVKVADGSFFAISGVGSVLVLNSLTLHNVLYVPNMPCNLLSISILTLHNGKNVSCFHSSICKFQSLESGKAIGSAKEVYDCYFV